MSGEFHMDPRLDRAWAALAEEHCSWERTTGRTGLVLFIPAASDEEVLILHNGRKQEVELLYEREELELAFQAAMQRRFSPTPL